MARTWHDIKEHILWTTKTDAYIYLSLFLLLFLSATIINDFICMYVTENTARATQAFTIALLLVHTIGVYVGLLSFVYITQTAGHTTKMAGLGLAALLGNILAFIIRVSFEVNWVKYREELYTGK